MNDDDDDDEVLFDITNEEDISNKNLGEEEELTLEIHDDSETVPKLTRRETIDEDSLEVHFQEEILEALTPLVERCDSKVYAVAESQDQLLKRVHLLKKRLEVFANEDNVGFPDIHESSEKLVLCQDKITSIRASLERTHRRLLTTYSDLQRSNLLKTSSN